MATITRPGPQSAIRAQGFAATFIQCLQDEESFYYLSRLPPNVLSPEGRRKFRVLYDRFMQDSPQVLDQEYSQAVRPAEDEPIFTLNDVIAIADDDEDLRGTAFPVVNAGRNAYNPMRGSASTPTAGKTDRKIGIVPDNVTVIDLYNNCIPISNKHHRKRQKGTDTEDEDDGAPPQVVPVRKKAATGKKGPGRPRTKNPEGADIQAPMYKNSWGTILIQKEFEPPQSIRRYLRAHDTYDAADFLGEFQLPDLTSVSDRDRILEFCPKVREIPHRKVETQSVICRLFLLLTVGDMVGKLGLTWNRRLKAIGDRTKYNEIEDTLHRGDALVQLSDAFGTGSIFYLWGYLTDNALQRKLSWNGKWFKQAKQHLKDTGCLKSIKKSNANVLGDTIRDYLSNLYGVDQMGSGGMSTHDEGKQGPDGDKSSSGNSDEGSSGNSDNVGDDSEQDTDSGKGSSGDGNSTGV